jgi:hypothetical protein
MLDDAGYDPAGTLLIVCEQGRGSQQSVLTFGAFDDPDVLHAGPLAGGGGCA